MLPGDAARSRRLISTRLRRGARLGAFGLVLVVGLASLAVAAVGIAHQLLPRQFTPAQQRAIAAWEVQRRWRAEPAGVIFPASVSYQLPALALDSATGLELQAERLGISPASACSGAVTGAAVQVLTEHHCSAALRATYADSSGGMVATVVVAVLPSSAAATAVVADLMSARISHSQTARAMAVAGTPAARFADSQRQLSDAGAEGPYVIMSAAGFSDGRRKVHIAVDHYLDFELVSLADGLIHAAGQSLGKTPAIPVCPGAPGC